jgi:VCBS repeat-containing protein
VGLEDLRPPFSDFNFTDLVFSIHSDVVLPSNAKLTVRPDGTFTYDPNGAFDALNAGEIGKDGFLYTVIDSTGASATGQVEIDILGVGNDGDLADGGFQVTEGQPVNPVVQAVQQQLV